MVVTGSYRGEEDDSVYIWMRRFESEEQREQLYKAVYESDEWKKTIGPLIPDLIDRSGRASHPHRADAEVGRAVSGGSSASMDSAYQLSLPPGAVQGSTALYKPPQPSHSRDTIHYDESGMLPHAERSGRGSAEPRRYPGTSKESRSLKAVWPEVRALIASRKRLLALGFALIAINRAAGLVLPTSTKYLIDDIIGADQFDLLGPLILAVLAATMIQGATDYGLTHLLSKSGQRLIAELRRKVQSHVGRLPVAYYDANKTGALVSRIMSDVEGVRNLVGTGLVAWSAGF